MLFKELRVGIMNGIILGCLSFAVIFAFLCIRQEGVFSNNPTGFVIKDCLMVAGSAGLALFLALSLSSILGLLLPVFFKKIKLDPAVASGPMITTINDIVSACVYYTLVGLFFGLL